MRSRGSTGTTRRSTVWPPKQGTVFPVIIAARTANWNDTAPRMMARSRAEPAGARLRGPTSSSVAIRPFRWSGNGHPLAIPPVEGHAEERRAAEEEDQGPAEHAAIGAEEVDVA